MTELSGETRRSGMTSARPGWRGRWARAWLVWSAFTISSEAGAQSCLRYHVSPIEPPPGAWAYVVWDINNLAQATGRHTQHGEPTEAFFWDPLEGYTFLGALGWPGNSEGYGINDAGHVAGTSARDDHKEGFFWSPETGMIGVGDLPGGGEFSVGYALNDCDRVVGYSGADAGEGSTQEAFLWDAESGIRGLGDLPGGYFNSVAYDVNDLTQVVGWSESYNGVEAFLWYPDEGMIGLGFLPGGIGYSSGHAINNLGQVTGNSGSYEGLQAFFWDPDEGMIGLGVPDGPDPFSSANDINDLGQVVGLAATDSEWPSAHFGFIWDRENGMRKVRELPFDDSASGDYAWIDGGKAINNRGQILGYAPDARRFVIITPYVPGDLNDDHRVDWADLMILLNDWGCATDRCPGDCDFDFDTDHADLGLLLAHWGEGCP